MPPLPVELLPLVAEFAPLFSRPIWERAKTLLVGAILAFGKRTITTCLLATGNGWDKRFQNYHRALSRSPHRGRRLVMLPEYVGPDPLGIDPRSFG